MDSYNVVIFGLELTLKPIAFTLPIGNGWDVYWYGIIIALGFLLAIIYAMKNYKRFELNLDRMLDVVLVAVPVSILCARTYYVLFDPNGKISSIGEFFGFGTGSGLSGIAIYGAVIGAFAAGGLTCYIRKVNILDMFDIGAIGFLIGQAVGRWGNFVNQEAFGSFTGSSWWGMESERTIFEMGEGLVHPCFLYESLWCLAGFFVLNYFSKKRSFKGQIVLLYCVWYGFGRAIIEYFRTDSLMIGAFKVSVLVSVIICIAAIIILIVVSKKKKVKVLAEGYEGIFAESEETEGLEEVKENELEEENIEENKNGEID
ncbi:MAG: prolipoprotein diacylglyceryl transferase [Clostridia bacterium]|nr:prolipoprotein diacylglyceryl transferase [Clostridia bacterium]